MAGHFKGERVLGLSFVIVVPVPHAFLIQDLGYGGVYGVGEFSPFFVCLFNLGFLFCLFF